MYLTREQINGYREKGYLLIPNCFSRSEVEVMRMQLPALFAEDSPERVVEKNKNVARSVYGSHKTNEVFRRLTLQRRLVEPARQILGSDVYVYQFKINAKAALGGDVWEWHQDYIFWLKEDGMPDARALNVTIFIDDMNEFNGPLFVIPGSQKEGMIDISPRSQRLGYDDVRTGVYLTSPEWISNLTADLKYSLSEEIVFQLVNKYGIESAKGPAGSVLLFHPNLVHGSSSNISPLDRAVTIITFNSTENAPLGAENLRPEFLVSRDPAPIAPLAEDSLLV
jgi:ectoine hydroxylase-related dioxygenase (phytanoyl-CoA dioxygenase family)